jgi:hypothetical protein
LWGIEAIRTRGGRASYHAFSLAKCTNAVRSPG